MKVSEYTQYDATGLAHLVRTKQVSPRELLDTAVDAIGQVEPQLNAVVEMTYDYAKKQIEDGIDLDAPFCGVPFVVKDSGGHLAGVPSTIGSRLTGRGITPKQDSTLMARFKRAGVLMVATTATPEMCWNSSTESLRHGATHNPWDLERSPGGSSGGTAALIASGCVPFGHGSDGGGSIRMPASINGLVGLKPTRFRIPNGPNGGDPGLAVNFILSRSVRDTAVMLDQVQGPDPGYYGTAVMPPKPYGQLIQAPPERKLRIAYMLRLPYGVPYESQECVQATLELAEMLRGLGHDCVEAYPPLKEEYHLHRIMAQAADTNNWIEDVAAQSGLPISEETLEPLVYQAYLQQRKVSAEQMFNAQCYLNRTSREIGRWMEDYDAIVCPTLGMLPLKLGSTVPWRENMSVQDWVLDRRRWSANAGMCNVTGMPSITVPFKLSREGLPIGMEIDGRMGDDALVLQLAAELERVNPWKDRHPAVYAH